MEVGYNDADIDYNESQREEESFEHWDPEEEPEEGLPRVQEWQNHVAHDRSHTRKLKSDEFTTWSPPARQAFLQHWQDTREKLGEIAGGQMEAQLEAEVMRTEALTAAAQPRLPEPPVQERDQVPDQIQQEVGWTASSEDQSEYQEVDAAEQQRIEYPPEDTESRARIARPQVSHAQVPYKLPARPQVAQVEAGVPEATQRAAQKSSHWEWPMLPLPRLSPPR